MKKFFTFFLALLASVNLAFAYSDEGIYEENTNFRWTFKDGLLTVYGSGEMPWYGELGGPWALRVEKDDIKAAIITEGITTVPMYCFYLYRNLEVITLPSTLVSFESYAICGCSSLRNIRLTSLNPPTYEEKGNYEIGEITLTVPFGSTELYITEWMNKSEAFVKVEEADVSAGTGIITQLPDTTVCYGARVAIGNTEGKEFYAAGTVTATLKAHDGKDSLVWRKVSIKQIIKPYMLGVNAQGSVNSGCIKIFDNYYYESGSTTRASYEYITVNGVRYDHKPSSYSTVYNVSDIYDYSSPSYTIAKLTPGTYTIRFHNDVCEDDEGDTYTLSVAYLQKNGIYYNLYTSEEYVDGEYKEITYAEVTAPYGGGKYALNTVIIPEKVDFGDGVEYTVRRIASSAFYNCTSLNSVTIPATVNYIGSSAFSNCSKLKEIILYPKSVPSPYSTNAFNGIASDAVFKVAIDSYNYYSYYWSGLNIQPAVNVTATAGPTTCVLNFEGLMDEITACSVKDGDPVDGTTIEYAGLEPGSTYSNVEFVVFTASKSVVVKYTFTTPSLKLTTLESKAASATTAILLAEANISEDETNCGFEWKRNDAPSDMNAKKEYAIVKNGMMAGRLKGLKDDVYYKYRAFYQSAAGHMYYGGWQYIFTGDAGVEFEPILTTESPSLVKEREATLRGFALAGSDDITEQGFEYWIDRRADEEPADAPFRAPAAYRHYTVQVDGIAMEVTLTNLDPGTVYKYRAYATAGGQTFYGKEVTFVTRGTYEGPAVPQAIDQTTDEQSKAVKILRNGQIFILRGERTYTLTGQEVK